MKGMARRPLWQAWLLLSVTAAVGSVLFVGAWHAGGRLGAEWSAQSTDDLAWLQRRFHIVPERMQKIRALHDAYLPRCAEYCQEIAAAKGRLEGLLAVGDLADPAIEEVLAEIGRWRARCQAGMLRHFQEVADALPPEQGAAYLMEMERLTLGSHEAIEQRMSTGLAEDSAAHGHGAHH